MNIPEYETEPGDSYIRACRNADVENSRRLRAIREAAEALLPKLGDRVKIVKGRKNKGTVGTLFWMKTEQYGYYNSGVNPLRYVTRIGVRLDGDSDAVVWDYISNAIKAD